MTVTYLPKGAKYTDEDVVIEKVVKIIQLCSCIHVHHKVDGTNQVTIIENGIELHVMPEEL